MNIEVQPPIQVQTGTTLYPPLVVSCVMDADCDFLQIGLVDAYGRPLEDYLQGTLMKSTKGLDGHGSSSSRALAYAAFPDLSINYAGTFLLQVHAIKMDYHDGGGGEHIVVATMMSREIYGYDTSVAVEVPCK